MGTRILTFPGSVVSAKRRDRLLFDATSYPKKWSPRNCILFRKI